MKNHHFQKGRWNLSFGPNVYRLGIEPGIKRRTLGLSHGRQAMFYGICFGNKWGIAAVRWPSKRLSTLWGEGAKVNAP